MISLMPLALAGLLRDPGLPVTPPTDGLVLWLDAEDDGSFRLDGEHVEAWAGKVGGAVTASGTNRPVRVSGEGRGPGFAVRFDGRNDVLRGVDFGRRADTWTLVALVAPLRPARGAIVSACPAGGDDFDPGFTVDLYGSGAQFDTLSVEGAGRQGGRLNQRTRATPYGVFSVVVVSRDNTEIKLYVDGALEGARPASPAETVLEEVRIGARHYGGRECEFLAGEVAKVLLYDRLLSDEERRGIEAAWVVSDAERIAGEEHGRNMERQRREDRMIAPVVVQSWPSVAAYEAAREAGELPGGPPLPIAELPVRTDLLEAIRLCMHCLNNSFDRDRDGEPFFYSNLLVDGTGEFNHSVNIGIPHVVGRCLLGNMAAALATGIPFPEDGLEILTRYLKSSFDNPDHLNSYFDPERGGERRVELHNMREGLWGLWAVMQTDEAEWAREKSAAMLRTLASFTDEEGRWRPELVAETGLAGRLEGAATPNAARVVDPLLAVHRVTADPLALELAGKYAHAGLEDIFVGDGQFASMDRSSGHVHSITSSLSGITEYALLTGDQRMVGACRRIIDVGVPEYFSSWGWGDEVYPDHPADEVSRGEMNQTGDVIRAALHLGAAGEARYYELAERYLRSMVLPTQHREPELREFMRDNPEPTSDAERDVVVRSVGGYAMQLPNDRMQEGSWPLQTQDITSGTVQAMAECRRHCVTAAGDTTSVNLHFDYDGEALAVESGLPLEGRLRLRAKQALRLRVRIPGWVDVATVKVNGAPPEEDMEAGYIPVGPLETGEAREVTFDVPCKVERETVDGTEYTTTWVGNQVVDIRPRATVSPIPF